MDSIKYGAWFFLCLALLACGCAGTPPARLYVLTPEPAAKTSQPPSGPVSNFSLDIQIPEYIDRPQILIRQGRYRLQLAELDRWAEPLPNMLTRVMTQSINSELDQDLVQDRTSPYQAAHRILVHILRLDGTPKNEVTLTARWSLQRPDRTLASEYFNSSFPVREPDIEHLVAAHDRAVQALSQDIAHKVEKYVQGRL